MEFIDSIEVIVHDLNVCYICNSPFLPDDEIVEILNENQATYKRSHFLCEYPRGGV
jgi:hypothetical protein